MAITEIIISSCIYLVIGIILVFAAMLPEYKDMICPDGFYQEDISQCGDGKGKWYQGSELKGNETISQSLKNIKKGADSITDHIIWRFPFIISFFVVGSIYLVALRRIPSGYEFAIALMICFLFTFFSSTFYNAHYYRFPQKNIKENIEYIENKLRNASMNETCDLAI